MYVREKQRFEVTSPSDCGKLF